MGTALTLVSVGAYQTGELHVAWETQVAASMLVERNVTYLFDALNKVKYRPHLEARERVCVCITAVGSVLNRVGSLLNRVGSVLNCVGDALILFIHHLLL